MSTTKRKRKFPYEQDFSEGGMTDRSFGPACDVNTIVRHYEVTGIDPYIERKNTEQFGFATSTSYEEAMRQTAEVESAFMELPSAERQALGNNPANWLDKLAIEEAEIPADFEQKTAQKTEPENSPENGAEKAPLDAEKSAK